MNKIVLFALVIITVFSCEKPLTSELQSQKEWLNRSMEEFLNKEEKSEDYRKSTRIIVDLEMMKRSNLYYKQMLESEGFGDRFNKEVIDFLDEKIAEYKDNENKTSSGISKRTTCNICGKEFVGRGYTEVSSGLWQLTKEPYQSFICSRGCGALHTERQIKKYGF